MGACVSYRIIIKKPAKKFIDRLPVQEKKRLVAAIEGLPENGNIKKLQGTEGVFRLRVGGYRVLYTVDHGELVVCVIAADSRGQVYKQHGKK